MELENQIFKPSQNQISTSLSGETIILNHHEGKYFSLNEVGYLIWNKLNESPAHFDDLLSNVLENFDVDQMSCKADIEELLEDLLNENLIEIVQ